MDQLSVAQLAIYATLSIPTFYILWKHKVAGLLGWGYLLIFFSLRIVGCAMELSGNTSAAIISNIGLSPMLLAIAGILHEAQVRLRPELNSKVEWLKMILYHVQVTGGVAILAVGASNMQSSQHPTPGDQALAKAGMGILTSAWIVLAAWVTASCRPFSRFYQAATQMKDSAGTMLLVSTLFAIPFLGIRVIYSLVILVSTNGSDSSMAAKVICSTVTEMIIAIGFCIVGLYTAAGAPRREVEMHHRGEMRKGHSNSERSQV